MTCTMRLHAASFSTSRAAAASLIALNMISRIDCGGSESPATHNTARRGDEGRRRAASSMLVRRPLHPCCDIPSALAVANPSSARRRAAG